MLVERGSKIALLVKTDKVNQLSLRLFNEFEYEGDIKLGHNNK
jgi:hypothetical protein